MWVNMDVGSSSIFIKIFPKSKKDGSSEERTFNEVKDEYEIALDNNGFKLKLEYIPKPE